MRVGKVSHPAEEFMNLVSAVLKRNSKMIDRDSPFCDRDDLFQEGAVELLKAAMERSPDDSSFVGYAMGRIRRRLGIYVREISGPVRIPVDSQISRVRAAKKGIRFHVRPRSYSIHDDAIASPAAKSSPFPNSGSDVVEDVLSNVSRNIAKLMPLNPGAKYPWHDIGRVVLRERISINDGEKTTAKDISNEFGCSVTVVRQVERRMKTIIHRQLSKCRLFDQSQLSPHPICRLARQA